ncbi:DUF3618 domain-containing protein [Lichenicoccus sp.]|uniref:DUF3618 domain-containing protein n=1 Tax=Lichenicoccus sp. TaxID=2781899 RepID=UPI003D110F98
MSENTATPEAIERDLDHTRARLDGHLDELRGRLSPGQVVDDLMLYFRGKEGAEFGRNLLDSVRGNPLPAAITGIGLTWLIAANPGAARGVQTSRPDGGDPLRIPQVPEGAYDPRWSGFGEGGGVAVTGRVRTAEHSVTRTPEETQAAYDARLDAARGQALGLARHSEESETSFSQRVRHALSSAQQTSMEKTHDLADKAGHLAGSASTMAQGAGHAIGNAAHQAGGAIGQGSGSLARMLGESPITLGALGLAAGALLGALLPQSDQEETALGGIAGQARDMARDFGQQAADGGGHVAQAVLDKGQASAQAHGLTRGRSPGELVDAAMSGSLAEDARQVASDVLRSGDEAIRKETGKA